MKILHLCSDYFGSGLYKLLLDELSEKGVENSVAVPVSNSFSKEVSDNKVKAIKCFNTLDRLLFFPKQKKYIQAIEKQLDINNIDLIHAHNLFSNGYAALKLKEKFNIPYIVAVRDTDLNTFFKRMPHLRKTGLKILKNAKKIIFLSDSYQQNLLRRYVPEQFKQLLELKSELIPNGIDAFWMDNKYDKKCTEGMKVIKILSVGIICKRKNAIKIVEAIDFLKKQDKNVSLTLVGRIDNKELLKRLLSNENVRHIEPQPKESLLQIYREHDIFVLPSKTETFGLVYAEAISQGLPVIYTREQGFDGQFEEGEVGYSVNCNNPREIAEKIIKIKNSMKDFENISQKANKFDWKKIAEHYFSLYKE